MAAAKKCIDRRRDNLLLAHDDLANFILKRSNARSELIEDRNGIALNHRRSGKTRDRLLKHKIVICPKVSAKNGTLQAFVLAVPVSAN
jgi:hypothetical protein